MGTEAKTEQQYMKLCATAGKKETLTLSFSYIVSFFRERTKNSLTVIEGEDGTEYSLHAGCSQLGEGKKGWTNFFLKAIIIACFAKASAQVN